VDLDEQRIAGHAPAFECDLDGDPEGGGTRRCAEVGLD